MDKIVKNQIKSYVKEIITNDEYTLFERMFDRHIIDEPKALKACVNHYYDKKIRDNKGHISNTVLDVAIEFEISTSMVKNIIYKYKHVRF